MDRREQLMNRVHSDYKMLEDMGYTVLGVYVQGSDNYGLSYEGSDIDTKAIVLPSFDDFIANKKPVSTTHILSSLEHCDIKDLRVMFETIKKQNINFVEILFTDYYYLNPLYEDLFMPMIENRELIARFNKMASVKCMIGMALEKRKALEHPYPTIKWKIDKWGYDGKQLHHILRMKDFSERYINGESYKSCLTPRNSEYLIDIKRNVENGEVITVERARELCDNAVAEIRDIGNAYIDTLADPIVDADALQLFNTVLQSILKQHFINEILSDEGVI